MFFTIIFVPLAFLLASCYNDFSLDWKIKYGLVQSLNRDAQSGFFKSLCAFFSAQTRR
ncbi:hypothetical protein KL86CLO1_10118 [uncultured Eubacteriales bacterium]|uniref:Uncharacterized protein n=1 Tax=uncultured Eubacteriales bacterium TaxID=172733 RepID=A0A212IW25_9FIRM|nr:hypothetical protein KL86CLO1_10118 [uncultured Eubacteriales bacterium]